MLRGEVRGYGDEEIERARAALERRRRRRLRRARRAL